VNRLVFVPVMIPCHDPTYWVSCVTTSQSLTTYIINVNTCMFNVGKIKYIYMLHVLQFSSIYRCKQQP
jgi:hypothetical protein